MVSSDNPPGDGDADSFTNDSRTLSLFCDCNLLLECYFYRRVQNTALLFLQLLSVSQSTARRCELSMLLLKQGSDECI